MKRDRRPGRPSRLFARPHGRPPLWKHMVKALPVVLTIPFITLFLQHSGWLAGLETASLDSILQLSRPLVPGSVVVVGITDDEYEDQNLFRETSPLDPEVLQRILAAIAKGRPGAIGVDLDTSSRRFAGFRIPPEWPPIVWACDGMEEQDQGAATGNRMTRQRDSLAPANALEGNSRVGHSTRPHSGRWFRPGPVLGGTELPDASSVGMALLPASFDSVLREYRRVFRTSPSGDTLPAFPFAVAQATGWTPEEAVQKSDENLVLSFTDSPRDFPSLTVSELLAASEGEGWATNGPLLGKIVLLGGLYRAGRDLHRTPLGRMYGVQLMAQAIEMEVQDRGIRPIGHGMMIVAEFVAGIVLAWLGYRFSPRVALLLSLLALPILGVLCSLVVFASFALWTNFSILLVGVVLHQMYDAAQESRGRIRELEAELTAMRAIRH